MEEVKVEKQKKTKKQYHIKSRDVYITGIIVSLLALLSKVWPLIFLADILFIVAIIFFIYDIIKRQSKSLIQVLFLVFIVLKIAVAISIN
jgi:hypothetical protein